MSNILSKATLISILFFSVNAFASGELNRAKSLNNAQNYVGASKILHNIAKNPKYRREQAQIAYELSKSLEGMGLKQSAVFQLIGAVRYGKGTLLSNALERLTRLAFEVGDDVGLNYALSKINIRRFPAAQKPVLYFRFGQAYLGVSRFKKAIKAFSKIPKKHYLYSKARYFMGQAYSESKKLKSSYSAFTASANSRASEGVVDDERVAALMGRARVLYHLQRWNDSLAAYRMIPRDSKYFHDMLFESSWAMLRSGKFRSAVSNFQSLHSKYYEDYFYPEAALLRAIVYLYICKVDEVNKVLTFYDNTYGKVGRQLSSYLRNNRSPKTDITEFLRLREELAFGEKADKGSYEIPYIILRHLNRSSKVRAKADYYETVASEIEKIESMNGWSSTTVGAFFKAALQKRQKPV